MPNLPGTYVENHHNFICTTRPKDKFIEFELIDNGNNDFSEILSVLNKYKNYRVTISNIYSRNILNTLCNVLSNNTHKGNIKLVISCYGKEYLMDDLTNNKPIIIELLPDNVKLDAFPNYNEQNEFTTWAHNLNYKDKESLKRCLTDVSKKRFEDQELVMYKLYRDIIRRYPSIRTFDERARFNIVFDYVLRNYPYSGSSCKPNGHIRDDGRWACDPIETYKRGTGVCSGRSNLITLVSNSPLLHINCITVNGETDGELPHAWNAFVDNGKLYHYDVCFPHLVNNTLTKDVCHKIESYYYCAKEDIDKSRIPELPPKRKKFTPPELPPRRKE